MAKFPDYVIAGAGITGLSIARELVLRRSGTILVLEKEHMSGLHASGRNSGVLHAGIYYAPGTIKARLCLAGNRLWKEYCRANELPLLETGKTIVTRSQTELGALALLAARAAENGARVSVITPEELREIEPHARTVEQALYSHETAALDPKRILAHLEMWLRDRGVAFRYGCGVVGRAQRRTLSTSDGPVPYGAFINAAGAWADRIARSFGGARGLALLPFRGRYRLLRPERASLVRGNIYPVPDLRNPFLGVHLSRNVHGDVYAGPTAAPVFGREQYSWLPDDLIEALRVFALDAVLFLRNGGFRANAAAEVRRYGAGFLREVRTLVPEIQRRDLLPSAKMGIRPQLVHLGRAELVSDFLVEKAEDSVHVLNAISPAFTSAPAFAQFLVDEYGIG